MIDPQKKTRDYYGSLESRLGYSLVMWDAKHFGYYPDKVANISEQKALELHQDLIAQKLGLKKDQIILDAGCGRGVTACYIANKYNANIVGVDLLDFEIAKARGRSVQMGLTDKTRFEVMDFSTLNFADEYFDGIYTSETLSHAPDVAQVLKEFYRALKPGGRLVLMEYTLAPDEEFSPKDTATLDFIIENSGMAGLKTFRHDQFPELLKLVGFKNVKEENITPNFRPSFDRLYSKSKWAYPLVKMLGLEKRFINASAPTLMKPIIDKGLFRYCIFTGMKPA